MVLEGKVGQIRIIFHLAVELGVIRQKFKQKAIDRVIAIIKKIIDEKNRGFCVKLSSIVKFIVVFAQGVSFFLISSSSASEAGIG